MDRKDNSYDLYQIVKLSYIHLNRSIIDDRINMLLYFWQMISKNLSYNFTLVFLNKVRKIWCQRYSEILTFYRKFFNHYIFPELMLSEIISTFSTPHNSMFFLLLNSGLQLLLCRQSSRESYITKVWLQIRLFICFDNIKLLIG